MPERFLHDDLTRIDLKAVAGKSSLIASTVVPPVVQQISKRSYHRMYATAVADRTENGRLVFRTQNPHKARNLIIGRSDVTEK